MKLSSDAAIMGAALLAGAGLLWWATRPGVAGKAGAAAAAAAGAAAEGVVKGVGQWVGIPDTNMTQCEKDMAAGDWWKASFSCPAGTFVNGSAAAAAGVVETAGTYVGVPRTSMNKCDADLAAGNYWDASFSCPAGTFVGAVFGSTSVNDQTRRDIELIESRGRVAGGV